MSDSKASKQPPSIALQFLAGSLAGIVAEGGTHPLDCIKTRLQLQEHAAFGAKKATKEASAKLPVYRGMMSTTLGIVKEEGVRKLYAGLPPALVRQVIKAGFQMSLYRNIREFFTPAGVDKANMPLYSRIAAAASAGMIGQVIANPCDVVKVRLQADGQRALFNKTPRYNGAMDAFRSILKDKGIAGFYRGLVPSVQRAGMNSGAGLASYDHIKQYLLTNTSFQDNTTTHSLTSVFSALCSTTCALPFDIIKTRIMNQSLTNPIYKNSFHCFTMTIQKEGILSMWKGFLPTYARVFPWQFLFFVSYEQFSKYLLGGGL